MKRLYWALFLTLAFTALHCQPLIHYEHNPISFAAHATTVPADSLSTLNTAMSYDESYKVGSHNAEYLTHYTANLGYGFVCGLTLGFVGVAVNQWTVKPTKIKNIPAGADSTGYADGFKTKSLKLNKRTGLIGSLFGTAAQTVIIVSIISNALHNITLSK